MNMVSTKGLTWKGRTIFQRRSRKQCLSAPSMSSQNIRTIPLRKMFITGHISSTVEKGRGVGSVTLIMERNTGRVEKQFRFESNDEDFELMKLIRGQDARDGGCNVVITMLEIRCGVPRLVLLCSEEVNWFTVLNAKRQEKKSRKEGV